MDRGNIPLNPPFVRGIKGNVVIAFKAFCNMGNTPKLDEPDFMTIAPKHYIPALRFSWLTSLYDPVVRLTTRERLFKRALLGQSALSPGIEMLDLGCGTGTLALWAKRECPDLRVVGIDGDPKILEIARAKAAAAGVSIQFDFGYSTALPYEDARFDRVLSSLFFHHLQPEEKQKTLAEAYRVLKPGGQIHIADWGMPANFGMRILFCSIQLLDGFSNTSDHIQGRIPLVMAEEGFQNVHVTKEISTLFGTLALYAGEKSV